MINQWNKPTSPKKDFCRAPGGAVSAGTRNLRSNTHQWRSDKDRVFDMLQQQRKSISGSDSSINTNYSDNIKKALQMQQQNMVPQVLQTILQNPAAAQNPQIMTAMLNLLQASLTRPRTPSSNNSSCVSPCTKNQESGFSSTDEQRFLGRNSSDSTGPNGELLTYSINENEQHLRREKFMFNLVNLIEQIFSNENIEKAPFLAKLFERENSSGKPAIPVKRIAEFKKVKSLTSDLATVQVAIRRSKMFTLSKECTLAVRLLELPADVTTVIKRILAINLEENSTLESLTKIFEQYGDIAEIQIIRPNKQVPGYLRQYLQWVPDLGNKFCAAINFENPEDAQKACREVNMSNRAENTLRVALLKPGARIKRTLYRKYGKDSIAAPIQTEKETCGYLAGSSNSSSCAKSDTTKSFDEENNNNTQKEQFTTKKFITLVNWRKDKVQRQNVWQNSNFTVHRQPKGPCNRHFGFKPSYLK